MPKSYTRLAASEIQNTADRLARRIRERFPEAALGDVCQELVGITKDAARTASWLAQPIYWVRVLAAFAITLMVVGSVAVVLELKLPKEGPNIGEFIQISEAALNDLVLIAAAAFFLGTLESRIKRGRALDALHRLRSLAHIIDMHQLSKDPQVIGAARRTESSPARSLDRFALHRYLDYCAEMLAVIGKVAALYAERLKDPVVLAAVNEVEDLSAGLARKIWQKLIIIHSETGRGAL